MKPTEQINTPHNRRGFLRGTLAASTGAVLAAALPSATEAEPVVTAPTPEPQTKQGYRETAHIAAYYKTAAN
ncbi:hypothetical protein [Thiofilum flexile]|uniref:hypothetical protein n=1 Tax=Thiofilum flexile TaxID=125627 RepID=UPI0003806FEF|nr:hypothetical protein [Thiofilum flexile]